MKYSDVQEAKKNHKEARKTKNRILREMRDTGSEHERTELRLRLESVDRKLEEFSRVLLSSWED